jgi:hypothetical protein
MTHEQTCVGIALDSDILREHEGTARRFAEAMLVVAGKTCNSSCCNSLRSAVSVFVTQSLHTASHFESND